MGRRWRVKRTSGGSASMSAYCLGARKFSEFVQRRSAGYGGRRSRHLQDGWRRKGDRALGHATTRRRPEKLGPLGRAEFAPGQSKRNVLKRSAYDEQSQ